MPDPRPDNVAPTPDLADIAIRPAPADEVDPAGASVEAPPAEDLTLPADG